MRGSWDADAVGDGGAGDDGAEEFGAGGEFEGFEAATEGVEEDEAGGVELDRAQRGQLQCAARLIGRVCTGPEH